MRDLKAMLKKLFKGQARVQMPRAEAATPPRPSTAAVARPRPAAQPQPEKLRATPVTAAAAAQAKHPPEAPASSDRLRQTTHNTYAHEPAPWVARGTATQPGDTIAGRVLPIRIGLDFGSAYSKAAISLQGQVRFVSWEGLLEGEQPLYFPDELTELSGDRVRPGAMRYGGPVRSELKLPLLREDVQSDPDADARIVVFLAWSLRYIRAWVWETCADLVRDRRIAWTVNLGCPAQSWSSRALLQHYERLARATWQLSLQPGEIGYGAARQVLAARGEQAMLDLDELRIVPEFIAEIAGYVFSPQCAEGPHLLIDVGAGTVDMACFNVVKTQGKYDFPIFSSAVEFLGTHHLMTERLKAAGKARERWDDTSAVPTADVLATQLDVPVNSIAAADQTLTTTMAARIAKVINAARPHWPHAQAWRKGVSTFLLGGGAECEVYLAAIERASVRLKCPLPLLSRGYLKGLVGGQALRQSAALRLAVAHGLTYDSESLGRVRPTQDIPNFVATPSSRQRPDRDEQYPK